MKAPDFLKQAAAEMEDRASQRDTPGGERSMGRTVAAFNAMFGTDLTEVQGWQFMELLKMSRSVGGDYRDDDHTDGVAYASLAGEAAAMVDAEVRLRELQSDILNQKLMDAIDKAEPGYKWNSDIIPPKFINLGDMGLVAKGDEK